MENENKYQVYRKKCIFEILVYKIEFVSNFDSLI